VGLGSERFELGKPKPCCPVKTKLGRFQCHGCGVYLIAGLLDTQIYNNTTGDPAAASWCVRWLQRSGSNVEHSSIENDTSL